MKEILDVIHNTIYQFISGDGEMSDKDKLLLEVNKAICNNLKALEPCEAISRQAVLDEINRIGVKAFETYDDYSQLYDFVDTLPPVTLKQPMQVELEADGYSDGELVYDWGKCPNCGWGFENGDKDWEEPYCCHCGQRLHWFE